MKDIFAGLKPGEKVLVCFWYASLLLGFLAVWFFPWQVWAVVWTVAFALQIISVGSIGLREQREKERH